MVALIGAVLMCFLVVPMFTQVLVWDGGVRCKVTVVVLEHESDTPVENADVQVLGSMEERMRDALGGTKSQWKAAVEGYDVKLMGATDSLGKVVLGANCGAGGRISFLGVRTGSYRMAHILEVTHPDYEPLRIPLASLLGEDRFPLSKKELAVKVWLIPKTSPH